MQFDQTNDQLLEPGITETDQAIQLQTIKRKILS